MLGFRCCRWWTKGQAIGRALASLYNNIQYSPATPSLEVEWATLKIMLVSYQFAGRMTARSLKRQPFEHRGYMARQLACIQ